MLADTGTVSFVLYGVFIAITLFAMMVAIRLIKNDIVKPDKMSVIIDLFKYSVVSVAIATTTLIISDLFKEREQDIKELEYFGKYVEVVMNADGVRERYQLAKYFSIVAPSGEMKKSWVNYYQVIEPEYNEYNRLKIAESKLNTIKNPTVDQIKEKVQLRNKIQEKESPLIRQSSDNSESISLQSHVHPDADEIAKRLNIDNTPTPEAKNALNLLKEKILDPIVKKFGEQPKILGDYRSFALNEKLGGGSTSQHLRGEAVDIVLRKGSNIELANWVKANLDFDQLIIDGNNPKNPWIHVSYRKVGNRHQALTLKGNTYTPL